MKKEEFSSAQLSKWFGIPRTNLFRWETEKRIPPTRRNNKGNRIYTQRHLTALFCCIRKQLTRHIEIIASTDGECPPPELLERLYRVEFFGGKHRHGLEQLANLARSYRLTEETIATLMRFALSLPRGHKVRRMVFAKIGVLDKIPS